MADPTIVLASSSPRRRALLNRLGVHPAMHPADIDERPRAGEGARALVTRLAAAKAEAIAGTAAVTPNDLVIAADTAVTIDGDLLGKPTDPADATAMLRRLAGRTHEVLTGVSVRRGDDEVTAVETTSVTFRPLTDSEITWYLETGEPFDKAGAYALQGAGACFVESISGNDTNVIGLPLPLTIALARQVGIDLLDRRGDPSGAAGA